MNDQRPRVMEQGMKTLTVAGQAQLGITQSPFRIEAEAFDLLDGLAGLRRGHLNIGAVGSHHVTAMIGAYSARYPDVDISVTMRNSCETEERLLGHRDDIATLSHQIDDPLIHSVHYFTSPIVIFVNVDHPWARRTSIRIRDLRARRSCFGSAARTLGGSSKTPWTRLGSRSIQ